MQTTNSKHWMKKYPNLAKDLEVTAPEQLWVSDITHLKTEEGPLYLTLITDAFSRRIMGHSLDDNMEASTVSRALKMALQNRSHETPALVHHSDRGGQYCSEEYVGLAEANQIQMSMTEHSDPYENALAERMNRTIKEEFSLDRTLKTRYLACLALGQAIHLYNDYRPHLALAMKTPNQVHQKTQPPEAVGLI